MLKKTYIFKLNLIKIQHYWLVWVLIWATIFEYFGEKNMGDAGDLKSEKSKKNISTTVNMM